jgi:hypothetical protein
LYDCFAYVRFAFVRRASFAHGWGEEMAADKSTRKGKTQRGFQRRSASAQLKATFEKPDGPAITGAGTCIPTAVLDLSEGGARLIVTVPLEVGEEVVLALEGPWYEMPIRRLGKIVWSIQVTNGRYAVGLHLQDRLGGEDVEQLTIPPARLDY